MAESSRKPRRSEAGFGRCPRWLLADPTISLGAKALFALLDDRGNRKGVSWYSVASLSDALGISSRSLRRLTRELDAVVAISSKQRRGSNLWKVHHSPNLEVRRNERDTWTPVSRYTKRKEAKVTRYLATGGRDTWPRVSGPEAEPKKQNQRAAAEGNNDESPKAKYNGDRQLAEDEARRRQAAGKVGSYGPGYVDAIYNDERVMRQLRAAAAHAQVEPGATTAPTPTQCRHPNKALLPALDDDEPDTIRCVGCGQEWQAGLEAVI